MKKDFEEDLRKCLTAMTIALLQKEDMENKKIY